MMGMLAFICLAGVGIVVTRKPRQRYMDEVRRRVAQRDWNRRR